MHWLVTTRGCRVLLTLMNEMGVLMMERLLVQELPALECMLSDGMPEYSINSNHWVQTARHLFPGKAFKWCCDIVDVCCALCYDFFCGFPAPTKNFLCIQNTVSEDDIHILAWAWNYMHDKAAVHKDEWEDFFWHCDTLQTGKFWTTTRGEQAIDWRKLISSMVHFVVYVYVMKQSHACCIHEPILTPPLYAARGAEAE